MLWRMGVKIISKVTGIDTRSKNFLSLDLNKVVQALFDKMRIAPRHGSYTSPRTSALKPCNGSCRRANAANPVCLVRLRGF